MPQAGAAAGEPAASPQARMQQMADELLAAAPGISIGDPNAPVVVYELSDFQCPACRMAATQFLPAFKQAYVETGRVRFVFVDFPLVNIHPNAFPAARAARCALEQDQFWAYHDILFEQQEEWSRSGKAATLFAGYAKQLGLDVADFEACYESGRYQEEVQRNYETAIALQARGTPTFFVQGKAILGAGREIVQAIEAALAAAPAN